MKNCLLLVCIIINIFTISCTKALKEKLIFKEKGKFNHINFDNILNNDSESIGLIEYRFLRHKISGKQGNFSLFLIDYNGNDKFIDSLDIVSIGSFSAIEPDNLDFSSKINLINGNYFSINGNPFLLNDYVKKSNVCLGDLIWLDKINIEKVSDNSKIIDKLPELDFRQIAAENRINFYDYKDQKKYIYVEFWATWCSPCISIIPEIVELNKLYSKRLEIISIHSEKSTNKEKILNTIEKYNMIWTNGLSNENVKNNFNFGAVPMGFLFDSKGELIIYDATPKTIKAYLENN